MGYILLPSLYIRENQSSEKLMDLLKMTESINGIARSWKLEFPTPKYGSYWEKNSTINM